MSLKAILFDLDGTLLPMEQERFLNAYFGGLGARLAPHGYDTQALVKAIWQGTAAMVKNDGKKTNEEVFWEAFSAIFGARVYADLPLFDDFYREDFEGKVRASCGFDPRARAVIDLVKRKGWQAVLATNPVFPSVATEIRIRCAGLSPSDFALYTTYENARFCKPNLDYYRDILSRLSLAPEECLMVGNDVGEDMVAEALGLRVFLLTDCLINKGNSDVSRYPQGGFDELLAFLEELR